MQEKAKVSVICLTYNHEAYIRDCLEGFVMQKTSFPFEVWVHDDASTDGTAAIVREYAAKYPDIIRPVFEEENQYSKGIRITKDVMLPKTKGRYLAICEGDDCWTDEHKLQQQVDYLDAHSSASVCVHRTEYRYLGEHSRKKIVPDIEGARDYTLEEIFACDGADFATCSIVCRREVMTEMPECFSAKGFGDLQMFLYGAIRGQIHCLAGVMAVYNCGVEGSWIERVWNRRDARVAHLKEKADMYRRVDDYYRQKYHPLIEKKIFDCEFLILLTNRDIPGLLKKRYRRAFLAELREAVKRRLHKDART